MSSSLSFPNDLSFSMQRKDNSLDKSYGINSLPTFTRNFNYEYFPLGLLVHSSYLNIQPATHAFSLFKSNFSSSTTNPIDSNFYHSEDESDQIKTSSSSITELGNSHFHTSEDQPFELTSIDMAKKQFCSTGLPNSKSTASIALKLPRLERNFCCCLLGDVVIGVGGPSDSAGTIKIWDATSGIIISGSICPESKDPMTSITSTVGNSFVIFSGWNVLKRKERVTLWSYSTEKQ